MSTRRLLLAAEDVGPARYLLAVSSNLAGDKLWFGSELTTPLFASAGCSTLCTLDSSDSVDVVVTGTCLGEGADKKAVAFARSAGIPVLSVVEHWTWFRERFITESGLQLPDAILVNDALAYNYAIRAGLPSDLLRIVGNPVLEEITRVELVRPDRDPSERYRLILFVSEDLATDVDSGVLPPLGYDEHSLLRVVIDSMHPNDRLIIKLHPAEQPAKYEWVPGSVSIVEGMAREELAASADIVVGMGSMLLLELALLGCPVISYQPSESHPFIGNEIGASVRARSPEDLQILLHQPPKPVRRINDVYVGSARRVADAVEAMVSG